MAITLTQPIIMPETSFNLVGVASLTINWFDFNKEPIATYSLKPYAEDEYGHVTMAPTQPINGRLFNLFTMAAERAADGKPALAEALQGVLSALQEIAHEKGQI
jgi:hypothetical protein